MMASLTNQAPSGSSLSTDQLTAHLTDEERVILQKVFQKEEQFREFALKGYVFRNNLLFEYFCENPYFKDCLKNIFISNYIKANIYFTLKE
jgi:hypothetical protein